jgi:pimeloyl-ACP methyl ester carboxylesterase
MISNDLTLDVSEAAGLDQPVSIAATLHRPSGREDSPSHLIFAVHGGGYTRAYWNPPFAAESYSFARWFTERGKAVLAIDMLGMGESSRPEPESKLSRQAIAAAHAEALRQTTANWTGHFSVTGVGHSMGGMMIITQAAHHPEFDRVAVIGWANEPMILGDTDVTTLQSQLPVSGYIATPREPMRKLFYADDVALSLIEADEKHASTTPVTLGREALTPGVVHGDAARITVPVLVVQSELDTSPAPEREGAYFGSAPSVELQTLERAAHCQNFATNRALHWERLNEWIDRTPYERRRS